MVERLFLAVPRGCLQFVIVVCPDHTHLLFLLEHDTLLSFPSRGQFGHLLVIFAGNLASVEAQMTSSRILIQTVLHSVGII